MIKVIIADDHAIIKESLSILLSQYEDIELIGTANNGEEVLDLLATQIPDIILMDLHMPRMDGLTCIKEIQKRHINVKIIILTSYEDTYDVLRAAYMGISGYLLKNISSDELHHALQNVYKGQYAFDSNISIKAIKVLLDFVCITFEEDIMTDDNTLTDQDREIIKYVIQGYSNKEIANVMFLSDGSVRNQISHILTKLHLRNRTQLATWGLRFLLNQLSNNQIDM
ncbi:MAG: response regulator transcription factor [Erysipelotrichaceae bacterium]|nr:response regulator transcription factor [Erysipelotrichaceae bacterium]